MLTLWDLLPKRKNRGGAASCISVAAPSRAARGASANGAASGRVTPLNGRATSPNSMRSRYDAMTRELLAAHNIRVRKWRTSMTGVAWEVYYHDGGVSRLIEAPRPKGPMSAAIFLHEIGHHAIGFNVYKPRCLEELRAWEWAIAEMERRGLNVTDAVRKRMNDSLRYAVRKASRRGIKRMPAELMKYT